MAVGREETYEFDGRKVRLVEVALAQYAYERSRWAVYVDGCQRGWILHPKGFGKFGQLWSVLGTPSRRASQDNRTYLDYGHQRENVRQREYLAERILVFMGRGIAPSLEEVEATAAAKIAKDEADKAAYAARRAGWIAQTVEQHEAVVALRDRLAGAGLLSNHETEVLDTALKNLFSGYQVDAIDVIKRRAAARAAGVPEDEPDAPPAIPSP